MNLSPLFRRTSKVQREGQKERSRRAMEDLYLEGGDKPERQVMTFLPDPQSMSQSSNSLWRMENVASTRTRPDKLWIWTRALFFFSLLLITQKHKERLLPASSRRLSSDCKSGINPTSSRICFRNLLPPFTVLLGCFWRILAIWLSAWSSSSMARTCNACALRCLNEKNHRASKANDPFIHSIPFAMPLLKRLFK